MTGRADTNATPRRGARLHLTGAAALLALASMALVELSIPALLVCLVAGLALPPLSPTRWRWAVGTVIVSAIVASTSLVRFATGRAMTGIVEAGQRATSRSAIWRLREIVIAEDGLRKTARIDPDGDGIGSADLIGALVGREPLRGQPRGGPTLLNYRFARTVETRAGLASDVGSHLLMVCLPRVGGGWVSRHGEPVDEEAAERRFVAYAWPSDAAPDVEDVVFVDEHERILVLGAPKSPFRGTESPPPCDAALTKGATWSPWKGKQPRHRLPGDAP